MSRLITLIAALLLVACSSEPDNQVAENVVTTAAPQPALAAELLARIEADTPALWLSLEPLPQALLEQLWGQVAAMSELQESAYDDMAGDIDEPLIRALLAELGQLNSPEAYTERGLNINGLAGLHLAGIFPLLHWELSDQDAFAATLARIEAESETPLPRRQVGDQEIIWVALDEFGLAIHHDASFMTVGLIADREDLLRRVANLDRPDDPLQRSVVDAFTNTRGYRQDSAGFIDFQRLLEMLMNDDEAMLVEARSDGPLAPIANEAACRSELEALTALFPRKSFGTTELSAQSMSMKVLMETDRGLGERLSALANSPVALAGERAGVLSMGLAINIVAARDFGRSIVGGWVENPPQCSLFSNIAENAANWQLALNRPIPPLVTNLHGARVRLDRLSLTDGAPSDAAGTVALFMRNPQMMVGMAQMFSPELAALDLRAGAQPQPLPAGMVPNLGDIPTWIGLSETGLGLAMGPGQDAALPAALTAGSADSAIFSVGYDMAAYAELLEAGMAGLPGQPGVPADFDPSEATAAFGLLAGIYSYMHQSLHLTPDGIDLRLRFDITD